MLIRSVVGTRSGALLGLLQEVGVLLGESTASLYWDLLKFCDSIDARHPRVEAECGFPMRVAVVDLQVHSPWVEGHGLWQTACWRAASFPMRMRERCSTESWEIHRSVPLVRVDQHLDGTVRGGSPNGGDQAPVSVTDRAWSSRPSRPHVAPTLRPKRCFGEGCWSSGSMLVSLEGPATREEAQDVLSAWWENACARPRNVARDSLSFVVTPKKSFQSPQHQHLAVLQLWSRGNG